MRKVIVKDFLYGVGLAGLIYAVGVNTLEIFNSLGVVLLVVVLVTVWLHKKTYGQAIWNLVSVARILQVPVIISLLGLGFSFYVNRYNTGLLIFVMMLFSLGSVGLSYKLLLDWTVVLEKKKKINIIKYKKIILMIAFLWLAAEVLLLLVSL